MPESGDPKPEDREQTRPTALVLTNGPWHARTALTLCRMAGRRAIIAAERPMLPSAVRAPIPAIALGMLGQSSPEERARIIDETASRVGATAIFPADRRFTRLVCECVQHLESPCIPLPDPRARSTLANKAKLAAFCDAHDLPTPETHIVTSAAHAASLDLGYPRVVKPATGENGRLVSIVQDETQLAEAVNKSLCAGFGPTLVQRHIDGVELGVSLLCINGKIAAHASKLHLDNGIGLVRFIDDPDPLKLAERLVTESRMHGLIDLDLMRPHSTKQPLLLECNPRLWASATLFARRGANFVDLALRAAEGREITQPVLTQHPVRQSLISRLAARIASHRNRRIRAANNEQAGRETTP